MAQAKAKSTKKPKAKTPAKAAPKPKSKPKSKPKAAAKAKAAAKPRTKAKAAAAATTARKQPAKPAAPAANPGATAAPPSVATRPLAMNKRVIAPRQAAAQADTPSPTHAPTRQGPRRSTTTTAFACDINLGGEAPAVDSPAAAATPPRERAATYRLHRRTDAGFEGIENVEYKPGPPAGGETSIFNQNLASRLPAEANAAAAPNWARVVRREIVGRKGPDPCDFHLRHFEVDPGGFSSFEQHRHVHAVIVESGVGEVRINDEWFTVYPGDVVYIGPNTPHQLCCAEDATQPFGFFCVVDAVRDRPVLLDDAPHQP